MNISPIQNNIKVLFSGSEHTFLPSYINADRMCDSFIKMAKIDSASDSKNPNVPSSSAQMTLAKQLAKELKEIGLSNVETDKYGFVYGTLKSNIGKNSPNIGFIAHLDTSGDAPSDNITPIIHKYKKGNINLPCGTVIPQNDLVRYKNQTIITSDGRTLLGADDKAGIAEILEALRVFSEHPELKHPTLKIVFTPDEEIGTGISRINLKKLGADAAYTVDGNLPDHLYTETFNSYIPEITIEGFNIHLGHAYGKLVNSIKIANSIISNLPQNEAPETTKEHAGYYHVDKISGNSEKTTLQLRIAEFDDKKAKEKIEYLKRIIEEVQKQNPKAKITLSVRKFFGNMKDCIDSFREVAEYGLEGIRRSGFKKPVEAYVRGGTDGSDLADMGLPTPNLGSGSVNYHSKKEFVSLEVMKKCCENIINTAMVWGENTEKVMPKIKSRRKNTLNSGI